MNKAVKEAMQKTVNTKIIEIPITIKKEDKVIYGKIYKPNNTKKLPFIILSHGYNGSNENFITECRAFAKEGYAALAYDFCGGSAASKSSGVSTDMTLFTEKQDLLDVFEYVKNLDYTDDKNIYLFGGSQGGMVTALAAEELKQQIKAIMLYFPALCIADNWRAAYPEEEKIPDTNDLWGLTLGKKFFTSIHNFFTFDNIGSYEGKVLIIHGADDKLVPVSYSEKAKNTYKNAELVILENEGHGFSKEGTITAINLIIEFLRKIYA